MRILPKWPNCLTKRQESLVKKKLRKWMLSLITVLEPLWGSSRDKLQAQVAHRAIKVLIHPYLPITIFKVMGVMPLLSVPYHPRRDTGSLQGPPK